MNATFKEMPLGRLLGHTAKSYLGAISKKLSHLEMDSHFHIHIIVVIDKTDGTLSQQEIANALQLDKTSVLRIIDNLSEKGFVKRTKKPDDRRAYIIKLTDMGKRLLPRIYKAVDELNKEALSGLTGKQIKAFYSVLEAINKNISGLTGG
ncbi:MAG: MarR family transcriptional regulator [Bacteroidota bacterium]